MKPAAFDLVCPRTVDEALAFLADDSVEARALAGGQSLVPLMNFRLSRPERLVSLNHVAELATLATDGDDLVIGSMVRQRVAERSPALAGSCPLLCEALGHVAHPAIRNRGTVGGSIAHADPAAELPALIVALGGTVVARSVNGETRYPAEEFFLGYFTTQLQSNELIVDLLLPAPGGRVGFSEVVRRPGDFALAGAFVELEERGGFVTWFGLGARPARFRMDQWPAEADGRRELLSDLVERIELDDPSEEYKRSIAVNVALGAAQNAEEGR